MRFFSSAGKRLQLVLAVISFVALLSACGGGGNDAPVPVSAPAPEPAAAPTPALVPAPVVAQREVVVGFDA